MTKEISIDNIHNAIAEINERFYDIPFGNSEFQNENFIINAEQTPGRAYRHIGLRIYSKLTAINELKYGRKKSEVDLQELKEKVKDRDTTKFDKMRAEIEIEEKLSMVGYTDKLLNDAIAELNYLYGRLREFPEYTREEFEAEERIHFESKFNLALSTAGSGVKESMTYMNSGEHFLSNLKEATKALA